jgi:hypothetical protein
MTDVAGVRASPGGRVTLRFTGTGYRALPHPPRSGSHLDRRIPVTDPEPVSVDRDGRTVTVLVLVDGDPIRYRARGSDGDALEREFRTMLSAPRPATGVGP